MNMNPRVHPNRGPRAGNPLGFLLVSPLVLSQVDVSFPSVELSGGHAVEL